MTAAIGPMKKVTLSLRKKSESGRSQPDESAVDFAFIYGVASDGLCPFELILSGKRAGDSLNIGVASAECHEYFGYLYFPLCQALGLQIAPQTINLRAEIITVSEADNREVVHSLAKALSHGGCGGSCGCGCG